MAGAMSQEDAGDVVHGAPPHTNGSAGAPGSSPPGSGSPGAASPAASPPTAPSGRRRGRCKWFNVVKGWGFITPDDGGQDVFVHQSVIRMTGFRSLGDDEEVEFECAASGKGLEATSVTGPRGAACCGSHRRPIARRRFRKIRCYNCGEFANHIAAKCTMGPQPKRCHHCKSEDHLIADCPTRPERNKKAEGDELPSTVTPDSSSASAVASDAPAAATTTIVPTVTSVAAPSSTPSPVPSHSPTPTPASETNTPAAVAGSTVTDVRPANTNTEDGE